MKDFEEQESEKNHLNASKPSGGLRGVPSAEHHISRPFMGSGEILVQKQQKCTSVLDMFDLQSLRRPRTVIHEIKPYSRSFLENNELPDQKQKGPSRLVSAASPKARLWARMDLYEFLAKLMAALTAEMQKYAFKNHF